jgi:hypothetical protein|mmetsp:Transcript_89448/g.148687  ORF Transcript_89448/g.148687 Transcript_89448/m.148687 type:complete len:171 (+) Transcript_89448:110-622(+)
MFNILGTLYTKLYNQRIMADQQGLRLVTAIPRMEQCGHRMKTGGEPPCMEKMPTGASRGVTWTGEWQGFGAWVPFVFKKNPDAMRQFFPFFAFQSGNAPTLETPLCPLLDVGGGGGFGVGAGGMAFEMVLLHCPGEANLDYTGCSVRTKLCGPQALCCPGRPENAFCRPE